MAVVEKKLVVVRKWGFGPSQRQTVMTKCGQDNRQRRGSGRGRQRRLDTEESKEP